MFDGAALTTDGGLTNSGSVVLDGGGTGGSSLNIGGMLTNSGEVWMGDGYGASTLTAQDLSNTGTIGIQAASTNQTLLSVAADAPSTWTGTVDICGNGLLEFGGTSQIGAIGSGAQINLDGPQAFIAAAGLGTGGNTALTGLTSNAGGLTLQDGATLITGGGLTNSGLVGVGFGPDPFFYDFITGTAGGSSLSIGGTLTNSGELAVGNGNVAAAVAVQNLSNTGWITLYGTSTSQSLLNIAADAPSTWIGLLDVSGNGLLEFGGTGQIGTIASGAQHQPLTAHKLLSRRQAWARRATPR